MGLRIINTSFRLVVTLGLCTLFSHTLLAQADGIDANAILEEYCVSCHNFEDYSGGVDLEGMDVHTIAEYPEIGEKVIKRLRAGMMPPVDQPR
ncbi:MAG: hypothetical protein HOK55_12075, partial [Gammaproteobacteria bacterium]|nr:hypothetical protein [Gammaproteobacteria bacterium]